MITPSPININELWIAGQVIGVTYYDDHDKLVFTLKNTDGKFCVELCPVKTIASVVRGDKVMVRGSLFSQRSGRHDTAKIRASLIHTLDTTE